LEENLDLAELKKQRVGPMGAPQIRQHTSIVRCMPERTRKTNRQKRRVSAWFLLCRWEEEGLLGSGNENRWKRSGEVWSWQETGRWRGERLGTRGGSSLKENPRVSIDRNKMGESAERRNPKPDKLLKRWATRTLRG